MMWIKSAVLFAIVFSSAAVQGEIYKWTDEKGQLHYDGSIAKSKMDAAEKVNPKNVSIMSSSPSESAIRYVPNPPEQNDKPVDAPAPDSAAADNGNTSSKLSPCEEAWRKYRESQACFAPYVISGGRVKAEAYQHCTSILQPALCN